MMIMMIVSRLMRWFETILPGVSRVVFCALIATCVFMAGLQLSAIAAPNDIADVTLSQADDIVDQICIATN